MSNGLNIYQRINKVMSKGLYLKKGSAGQGTGVLYDELIAVLSPHLIEVGIVITTEKSGESRSRKNAKGNYIYECDFCVHYINIDNPQDRFLTFVESHSMDMGDKAPGKAITYATKISMLKVFGVETGLNEEGRAETNDTDFITESQQGQLYELLCDSEGMLTAKGTQIARAFKFQTFSEIKSKKFNDVLKAAVK